MIAGIGDSGADVIDSRALTALSHAGGCARKVVAADLIRLLRGLPA